MCNLPDLPHVTHVTGSDPAHTKKYCDTVIKCYKIAVISAKLQSAVNVELQ